MQLNDIILFVALVMLAVLGLLFLKQLLKMIVLIIAFVLIIWALNKLDIISLGQHSEKTAGDSGFRSSICSCGPID